MIDARRIEVPLLVVALAAGLIACGRGDDAPPAHTGGAVAAHDTAALQAHPAPHRAQEVDSATAGMRRHVQAMQQVSPEQWHARMAEHASEVERLLSLVERRMHEPGPAPGDMGTVGVGAEEHQRLVEQMQGLRAEVAELRTAPLAEVRRRMPDHLTRVQQLLLVLERSVEPAHEGR
jgi:hypothetical protein